MKTQPAVRFPPDLHSRTGREHLAESRAASRDVKIGGMCWAITTGTGKFAGREGSNRARASGPPVETPMVTICTGAVSGGLRFGRTASGGASGTPCGARVGCQIHGQMPLDFIRGIAQSFQEVVVGGEDGSVHAEFDDRLRLADGRNLALEVGLDQLLLGDVGGVLYDLERLAVEVEDRVVRSLDPNFPAALADAFVFGRVVFAAVQLGPEFFVGGALFVSLIHEKAVVLAL